MARIQMLRIKPIKRIPVLGGGGAAPAATGSDQAPATGTPDQGA